jgi:hypothetical protein
LECPRRRKCGFTTRYPRWTGRAGIHFPVICLT